MPTLLSVRSSAAFRIGQYRVGVLVGWGATAKEFQHGGRSVGDLVEHAGRDGDGIARPDQPRLLAQPRQTVPLEDVVDFLRQHVVMCHGATAGGQPGFCQRLVPDRRVAVRQKLTDEETVALARLGSQVEEHYGKPQDIEWAEENGVFYIVQARPITTG